MRVHVLPGAGLDAVLKSLNNIIDDVKRKPYDLLDYTRNQFDRDFLEFNVNIHELESGLQARMACMVFIHTSSHP
jgi:Dynein heavy chain, N-terminal region 1